VKAVQAVPAPYLVGVELNPGPKPGGKLSKEERWRIVFLSRNNGLSQRKIAKETKTTQATVCAVLEKYRKTQSVDDLPKTGRKKKISENEEEYIARQAKKGKKSTQLAREYGQRTGKTVHPTTVQRVLKRRHLAYLKIKTIPRLTEDHKARRVQYAHEMANANWKQVLFTDEKSFWLETTDTHAWQERGKRKTVKKSRWVKKLHVWGGIGYFYKTNLHCFEANMNAELYQSILRKNLPPDHAPDCPARYEEQWEFLQDNDPKHTAAGSIALLQNLASGRIHEHPPNSPDFNIIEDVWSYLDREIRGSSVKTIQGLKRKLKSLWRNIPWRLVRQSVNSMPVRLEECIARNGERTSY